MGDRTSAVGRRLLVTGGKGMVGSYAAAAFEGWEVLAAGHDALDVLDGAQLRRTLERFQPDVVLHLAAATDVDRCQTEPDWAFRVNAIGTQNVALAARARDALLVYASTGAVFPGDRPQPYTEFDPTGPSNLYGRSKLAGETLARELSPRHLIVRGGWIFGGGAKDKKFVGTLVSRIRAAQTPLRAVNDKFGTPTYAKDFLGGVRRLIEGGCLGVYHMGNEGFCTRYDVAAEIRRILGDERIAIEAVRSDLFPLPAPRACEAIRNYKLELAGGPPQRPWQQALREYVETECQALLGKARV